MVLGFFPLLQATNVKRHEAIGLLLIFSGTTWLGLGLYFTILAAERLLISNLPLISGKELLLFPLFYGVGALITVLGNIELKEAKPGKGRK